jgi:YD repeat-containing protein
MNTTDVFGNLTKVTEMAPGGSVDTTYTYDNLDHLTAVNMTRGSVTQQAHVYV